MKIKKKVALSGLLLCCAITAKAQVCITPQVEQRARELVSQMTLEEKIEIGRASCRERVLRLV